MECAFHWNFVDTLEQECTQAALKQGFQMKGEDMDEYVAKFKRLAWHAGYNLDDIQTLDLFTAGLPNALYQKVYELNVTSTTDVAWLRRWRGSWDPRRIRVIDDLEE